MSKSAWLGTAGLLALFLLGWVLRLFRLDAQSIWWDEGISLHLATSPLAEILRDRLNNVHPPLYFILLKGWVALAGHSAFSGRYLSTLASLLQVALVFTVARARPEESRDVNPQQMTRFSKSGYKGYRVAWLAAVLVAISPLSIIYGQEIRVYAMLPLAYLAMLIAAGWYCRSSRATVLLALAAFEWLALHLHYIAIFAVAYVAAWGAWRLRQQQQAFRRWIVAHCLIALATLPWLAAVFLNRAAVQSEANAGTFASEPVPLDYLLPQVWTFHLTGLANALARPAVVWIAGAAAVTLVVALLLVARVANPQHSSRVSNPRYRSDLLLQWLLPLSSALVVWSVRSFSHPRYVIIFAIALFPLLAVLIAFPYSQKQQAGQAWPKWAARGVSFILLLAVLYLSAWGLEQYFFNPDVAKPDMRGVAHFLETVAGPGDIIIIPETDWSLPYEYHGSAQIVMAPPANCTGEATGLDVTGNSRHSLPVASHLPSGCPSWNFTSPEPRRAYAIEYPQGTRDWQARTSFELERQGALVATHPFDDLVVREYELEADSNPTRDCQDSAELGITPVEKRFGPLLLRAGWVEQDAAADTAITLSLCWELLQPATGRYRLAMRLLDRDGWIMSQADAPLVDNNGRPIDQWPSGATVTTYHVLPLAPGTPPLEYSLALGIYLAAEGTTEGVEAVEVVDEQGAPQGQQIMLGNVRLSRPQFDGQAGEQPSAHNPYNLPDPPWLATPITFSDGLRLLAFELSPGPYLPGQSIPVYLTWQAMQPGLLLLEPEVSLEQYGEIQAATRGQLLVEQYPTLDWQPGEMVRERRMVEIPVLATPGVATLTLRLGERSEWLGEVEIGSVERLEALPQDVQPVNASFGELARLAGYSLPQSTFHTGEDVAITLYWQAIRSGEDDYTVFVHILNPDGRLIGQHDGAPAEGRRPTGGWVAGEFIADTHFMVFRDPAYSGPATIEVGLYDPQTGRRLELADGSDAFRLPAPLTIQRSSD